MKKTVLAIFLVAMVVTVLLAQNTDVKRLVVNGKPVNTTLIQREGRYYADLEVLAQAMGGSVSVQPGEIVLSLGDQSPRVNQAVLSKPFQQAAVFALSDMRQWSEAIEAFISSSLTATGKWPQEYGDRAQRSVSEAAIAASTEADHKAAQLLQAQAGEIGQWADSVIDERNNMQGSRFVDPTALQDDAVLTNILRCGQFLESMIVQGRYSDDASCH